ncbi:MAG: adenylate kinase [Candidatus Neomarinimicrobiota bacterium]
MRLVMVGPPGGGKGTQANLLKNHFNILHLSTGEILRTELNANSKIGEKARIYMDKGHLVPDEILLDMMARRLKQKDCESGYLLDGFPRTIPQAQEFDKILINLSHQLDAVIELELRKEKVVERLSNRMACLDCGEITNLLFHNSAKKETCRNCGGKLYQRKDDKPQVILQRLKIYDQQTSPLLDYYREKGILRIVNGEGDIKKITSRILEALK